MRKEPRVHAQSEPEHRAAHQQILYARIPKQSWQHHQRDQQRDAEEEQHCRCELLHGLVDEAVQRPGEAEIVHLPDLEEIVHLFAAILRRRPRRLPQEYRRRGVGHAIRLIRKRQSAPKHTLIVVRHQPGRDQH